MDGSVFGIANTMIAWSNNLGLGVGEEGIVFTEDLVGLVEYMGLTFESNYDFRTLGDLLTTTYAYGTGLLNPEAGVLIKSAV